MPKYAFECPTCSVRFERNLKLGAHTEHVCPSCKEPAPLVLEGFGFSFSQGTGSAANSGVHDHDYPTADKIVGRSSSERWQHLRARDEVKNKARKMGGSPALIRRHGKDYIEYETMTETGREAHRKLTKEALKRVGGGRS